MKRVFRVAVSMSILGMVAVAVNGGPKSAGTDQADRPQPMSVRWIDKPFMPKALSGEITDVVVQLSGQSVAEVQTALGRKTSRAEKDDVEGSLKPTQDAARRDIESMGGTVTNQFQSAINGIRVRIAANRIELLRTLPNVVDVLPVQHFRIDNSTSVPYIGASGVWDRSPYPNLHGEGIKIGIIDTGIDYTHADFKGPGTPSAFATAFAAGTLPADPSLFGPTAPKVKGGYDFVGDDYDAEGTPAQRIPHPDSNPLDCDGHGSHVAGTAAGFGVTGAGATYTGPYNSIIYAPGAFRIGPGVAPKADLYAYRVFGCAGSTDTVVDAIDRAVNDDMDVINMSLGSPFGTARTADAVAVSNAAKAGVIVVASAGNEGFGQYITGEPASSDSAISVAANDAHASLPGVRLTLSSSTITGINANEAVFADGTTYRVMTVLDNPSTAGVDESLGCNLTDYPSPPAGTIVVVNRGTCARVYKAIIGQRNGAAAVVMVNSSAGLPPWEGTISYDPVTGLPFTVTIPFFGIQGTPSPDGPKLNADSGKTIHVSNTAISNPEFSTLASFTSGGPRNGDSALKPDITAPGYRVFSVTIGTGHGGEYGFGTSMASPHVAGVAALVRQAHPTWSAGEIKAAIISTANPGAIAGFEPRLGGAGLVQPFAAVQTNAFATGDDRGNVALNFGFEELSFDLNRTGHIKIQNRGRRAVTFNVSVSNVSGVPHSLTPLNAQVTVQGNADRDVELRLRVPAASVGDSLEFHDAAGIVSMIPTAGGNNGITLCVPYYLVPRALSIESAKAAGGSVLPASSPSTSVTVMNQRFAAVAGNADFYAWGIHDDGSATRMPGAAGRTSNIVSDVGVQAFQDAGGPGDPLMVFGLSTFYRWSNAATNEFDIYIDVDPQNNNGDDYVLVAWDFGFFTAGTRSGQMFTSVFSFRSDGASFLDPGYTFAPTDGSSAALPVFASQLCRSGEPCLSPASPRITYHIVSIDLTGTSVDIVPQVGKFNAFSPSITTGAFLAGIAPGTSASTIISINPAEWAKTPALGVLVLTTDNKAGPDEAQGVKLSLKR